MHNIKIKEDQYLLSSLTKACHLQNDQMRTRLPIQRGLLKVILKHVESHFLEADQPYLASLYQALFSTMYFGLFWVSEVAAPHPILARDVHSGNNKKKMLFILCTLKTHAENSPLQMVKISSSGLRTGRTHHKQAQKNSDRASYLPCPFELLKKYTILRGGYKSESEPFFIFHDRSPLRPTHVNGCLKMILKTAGFKNNYYGSHSLRAGRSCDVYQLGIPVSTIKKLGRWRSNAVY